MIIDLPESPCIKPSGTKGEAIKMLKAANKSISIFPRKEESLVEFGKKTIFTQNDIINGICSNRKLIDDSRSLLNIPGNIPTGSIFYMT